MGDVSCFAEVTLFGDGAEPWRHLPWEPQPRKRGQHKQANLAEPLDIRRLRKLMRQVEHRARCPNDLDLLANIMKAVRRLIADVPEVGHLSLRAGDE